ncbi:MAG TPA: NYN domain-containing protein [Pseudonocardia sp.]|jgi:predicted RNA-binding protein with PIN domain|uniref:NYN domain-containing protein n=1 Tax=Pseudonocardia sp. TaxID=60912 RepID=UPI002F3ED979
MVERAWTGLPEPVRARLAEVASVAMGELPRADLPATLRPLARFTPTKRARLGARALLQELGESAAFRAAVLAWWAEYRPGELTGSVEDPVGGAAGAVLTDAPDADERVAAIAERSEVVTLLAQRDAALARVEKLSTELERLRAELSEARSSAHAAHAARDEELARLRKRVREQGMRVRVAEDGTHAAERELARVRRYAAREVAAAITERDRAREHAAAERTRAARAGDDATDAREGARETHRAAQVRLELLVDTAAGALAGLRRELALGGDGPRPADLVGGARLAPQATSPITDPAGLDRLLVLPSAHLIVDGYNVSKTGYPELTLFDQRARLVGALGALVARTGAEVTVVFDGAEVLASPGHHPRGVRVLFSDPGVLADDVIRALVAAEPSGRPVVVATSDRAVAGSVRRDGAHSMASSVLLNLLARG